MPNKDFPVYITCPQLTFAASDSLCPQRKFPLCSLPFPGYPGGFHLFFIFPLPPKLFPFHSAGRILFILQGFAPKSLELRSVSQSTFCSPSNPSAHLVTPTLHLSLQGVAFAQYYMSLLQHPHFPNCEASHPQHCLAYVIKFSTDNNGHQ